MKRNNPEHKLQVALMDYLQFAGRKDLHWFAIPNGGHRHIAEASRLKNEGVKSGSPDLCFMLEQGRVAWLEMKASKGVLGPNQKEFKALAERLGHQWGTAKSLDEAIALLRSWGVLKASCGEDYQRWLTSATNGMKRAANLSEMEPA